MRPDRDLNIVLASEHTAQGCIELVYREFSYSFNNTSDWGGDTTPRTSSAKTIVMIINHTWYFIYLELYKHPGQTDRLF